MQGTCKLCNQQSELEISHFIPKFVGKWVKKTSITGYIRRSDQVHKRAQDTAKEHWLCGGCEDLFSKWETKFATNVFYPFVDKEESVAYYESWMPKFCASLSWRTLTYIKSINKTENKSKEYSDALIMAEIHLADYLLGKVDNLNQYEQHVFPLEKIGSTTEHGLPPNINRYFLRTIGMDIIGNSSNIYTYTKLPSFIILGVIQTKVSNKMRSSRIALKSGKISPRTYWWPDGFIHYIVEMSKSITESHNQIPQKHLNKFDELIKNNPEKAAASKQFEAFLSDYELFGNTVFK